MTNSLVGLKRLVDAIDDATQGIEDPLGEKRKAAKELCLFLDALSGTIEGQQLALTKIAQGFGQCIAAAQSILALSLKAAAVSQADTAKVAELEGKLADLMNQLN